jgi:hypothetical protein
VYVRFGIARGDPEAELFASDFRKTLDESVIRWDPEVNPIPLYGLCTSIRSA